MTVALVESSEAQGRGQQCEAKTRSGTACLKPAGYGTDHVGYGRCKFHGGSTPTQRRGVVGQIVDDRARTLFGQSYTPKPVTNPLAVFEQLSGKVTSWMEVLERLVAELDRPGYAALTGEQIRAEVQLFERALDRCNTVLATHARLNIDERLARVSEAQAAMILGALDAGLAAIGVTGAKAVEARRVAGGRLRTLEKESGASAAGG